MDNFPGTFKGPPQRQPFKVSGWRIFPCKQHCKGFEQVHMVQAQLDHGGQPDLKPCHTYSEYVWQRQPSWLRKVLQDYFFSEERNKRSPKFDVREHPTNPSHGTQQFTIQYSTNCGNDHQWYDTMPHVAPAMQLQCCPTVLSLATTSNQKINKSR